MRAGRTLLRSVGLHGEETPSLPFPVVVLSGLLSFSLLVWALLTPFPRDSQGRPIVSQGPAFDSLIQSTGVLKRGVGGERYIIRAGGRSLTIACADHYGRGANNWCLYEKDDPWIGRTVTVFHLPVHRTVTEKASYYELRAGEERIVRYEDIAGHKRRQSQMGIDQIVPFSIMLFTSWCYWFAIRFQEKRRRLTDGFAEEARTAK